MISTVIVEHLQGLNSFSSKCCRGLHVDSHSYGVFIGKQVVLQACRPSLRSDTSIGLSVLAPASTMVERSGMSRTREQYLHHVFSNKDNLNFRPKYLALHWYLLPTRFRHEGCRRSSTRRNRAPGYRGSGAKVQRRN